jgi:hypothetical protein
MKKEASIQGFFSSWDPLGEERNVEHRGAAKPQGGI